MKKLFIAAMVAGTILPASADAAVKDFSPYDTQATSNAMSGVTDEYLMRAGDQLQITVYGHEELSSQTNTNYTPYVVRPDGHMSMPLIGDIDVNNKTVTELTDEITRRLSRYIKNPSVNINIVKLGSTRVYVLGEVGKPGMYELEKSHNLLDAIGAASGFTEYSAKKKVAVIRSGSENPVMMVNINKFLTKGDLSQNIQLYEGDCVYLTSNGKINFSRDILPWISAGYYINRINNDD